MPRKHAGKRIGRILWYAALGAVLLLASVKVVEIATPAPQVGHWRSFQDRAEYLATYREVLATIREPDRSLEVSTDFGTAHVVVWEGPEDSGAPVLLMPGRSSGAPMWVENLPSWIGTRTVIALDPIGDAGLSTQSTPLIGVEDQAAWISQVVQEMGLGPVHAVGHSFGGSIATEFALAYPDQVASLALMEPVMVVQQLPPSTYLWGTVALLPLPQSWRDRALAEIGGTTVEEVRERTPMSEMINTATQGYSAALPMPRKLTDEQWRSMAMPIRLDIGGESVIAGGQRSIDRIEVLLPSAATNLWPGATHSLPMDEPGRLGEALAGFWNSAER